MSRHVEGIVLSAPADEEQSTEIKRGQDRGSERKSLHRYQNISAVPANAGSHSTHLQLGSGQALDSAARSLTLAKPKSSE